MKMNEKIKQFEDRYNVIIRKIELNGRVLVLQAFFASGEMFYARKEGSRVRFFLKDLKDTNLGNDFQRLAQEVLNCSPAY